MTVSDMRVDNVLEHIMMMILWLLTRNFYIKISILDFNNLLYVHVTCVTFISNMSKCCYMFFTFV